MVIPGAPLTLFNTISRSLDRFTPAADGLVRMYTCGPTVYAYAHIGNLRSYISADLLRRLFEWKGLEVRQIMNITDVGHLTSDDDLGLADGEDKLELASRREGRSIWEIADHYTAAFKHDLRLANVGEPTLWTKATDYIPQMIDFAARLEANGHAYLTPAGLYFDTKSIDGYGKLADLDLQGLREGARVTPTDGKRNAQDFALWRLAPKDQQRLMEWDSPWGRGAPGWHLECSVMSISHLGDHFDIHTGGVDHIPVHHTNEIAQSEAYLGDGQPWVAHWFHNEFLIMRGGKTSKSKGDTLRVQTLVDEGYAAPVYRYFVLTAHYRRQVEFSYDALDAAGTALRRLADRVATMPDAGTGAAPVTYEQTQQRVVSDAARGYVDELDAAMSHDLNSAKALATLSRIGRGIDDLPAGDKKAVLAAVDALLGIDIASLAPDALWGTADADPAQASEFEQLIAERDQARQSKNFARADAIREELQSLGLVVEDTPEGTRVAPR